MLGVTVIVWVYLSNEGNLLGHQSPPVNVYTARWIAATKLEIVLHIAPRINREFITYPPIYKFGHCPL